MPSARSVAFRRDAIEAAGMYPAWLDIGEDMWVNHRWRELGLDMRFAPDAIARWRLRPTLRATWIQYFRYARGDALAGMHPERHAVRIAAYAGLAAALASRRRWPKALGRRARWRTRDGRSVAPGSGSRTARTRDRDRHRSRADGLDRHGEDRRVRRRPGGAREAMRPARSSPRVVAG